MRGRRSFGLLILAAVVLACAATETPDHQVPLTSPGGEAYNLLVFDETDLVTGGESAVWRRDAPSESVTTLPDAHQLEVQWTGGACEHTPTLRVTGGPGAVHFIVNNPEDPNWLPFLPVACPAVGVPLTVKLTFSLPVQPDPVPLEVHWR
jgi:hypothetical protein